MLFLAVLLLGPTCGIGQTVAGDDVSHDQARPIRLDTDPHLMGRWNLDASGKTAADSSKHGRHGVLKGGESIKTDSASGRAEKAFVLDGEDSFVEVIGYKGVAGPQPRTVTAWIKTESSRGEIVAWGEDDFGKMWVLGFVRGHMGVTPNGGYFYINDQINDGQWHHVAAVVEEAETPNLHDDVRIYVDAALAKIHDIGLLDLWPIDTGTVIDVRIGRKFKGLIEDVRIYDRSLLQSEVQMLFGQKRPQSAVLSR